MNRISCVECRQCNRKGKPSVTRYSKYCDNHYIGLVKTKGKFAFFTRIKDRLFEKRFSDEKGDLNTKGFRKGWFFND